MRFTKYNNPSKKHHRKPAHSFDVQCRLATEFVNDLEAHNAEVHRRREKAEAEMKARRDYAGL